MSAADIEGLPSYPTEEGSGRGITLLTSPMSCTLPFVAFPVCGAGQIRDVREVLSRKTPTFGDGYVQPGKALGGGFKYFCMFTPI